MPQDSSPVDVTKRLSTFCVLGRHTAVCYADAVILLLVLLQQFHHTRKKVYSYLCTVGQQQFWASFTPRCPFRGHKNNSTNADSHTNDTKQRRLQQQQALVAASVTHIVIIAGVPLLRISYFVFLCLVRTSFGIYSSTQHCGGSDKISSNMMHQMACVGPNT